jgi:hypothetical protein
MLFEVPWPKIVSLVEELYPQDARELKLMTGEEAAETVRAGNPTGANQHAVALGGINNEIMNSSEADLFTEPEPPARKKTKQGTSAGYILRRLHRLAESDPAAREALEGYRTGGLASARAAGIKAGIVKPPTPLAQLRSAWKRASDEHKAAFRREIAG